MDQRSRVWIGAIIGVATGLGAVLGSLVALYASGYPEHVLVWGGAHLGGAIALLRASVKHTKGPRERTFVIRASVLCLVMLIAFLIGMLLIPDWYKHLLWIPYVILLVFGLQWWSHVQSRIQRDESRESA